MEPILDFAPKLLLVPQLFGNFPICNPFSTLTGYGLPVRTSPQGRIFGDWVIGNYSPAIWAGNLVFHFFLFSPAIQMAGLNQCRLPILLS
jgi:hypothetical protein